MEVAHDADDVIERWRSSPVRLHTLPDRVFAGPETLGKRFRDNDRTAVGHQVVGVGEVASGHERDSKGLEVAR
jgi:hypothetical protein